MRGLLERARSTLGTSLFHPGFSSLAACLPEPLSHLTPELGSECVGQGMASRPETPVPLTSGEVLLPGDPILLICKARAAALSPPSTPSSCRRQFIFVGDISPLSC